MTGRDEREQALEDALTRALIEYVFDVNGYGERRIVTHDMHEHTVDEYDVDQDVVPDNGAAAILVRRSDGARFDVFASASVGQLEVPTAPSGAEGETRSGGGPGSQSTGRGR